MSLLILVVDDESDVEMLFRQQFRRDLRAGRFTMDFAQSADSALRRISGAAGASLVLILSDINMPGTSGLELLPKAKAARPDVPVIMITAYGDAETRRKVLEGGAEALLTILNERRFSNGANGTAATLLQARGSGWLHAYVPRAAHDDDALAALRSRTGDAAFNKAWAQGLLTTP